MTGNGGPGQVQIIIDEIGGTGIIEGDVTNQGNVNPGTPGDPGTLTINGDYTQGPSGQLTIDVASPEDFDRLDVNGTASLDGTLAVVADSDELSFGQKFPDILTADTVLGAFDTILVPAGFRGRVIDQEGSLTLLIAPASYTQVAQSPNQFRTAQALDEWIGIEDGDIGVVTLSLDELTAGQYPTAFEAIGLASYSSLLSISIEQSQARGQLISQQLSAARLAARPRMRLEGVKTSAITYDKNGKSVVETAEIRPTTLDNRWGLWALGTGLFGKTEALDSIPSYRFNTGGFLVGADYSWNESFLTGLFGGYEGTDVNYANSGDTQSNAFRFGIYGTCSTGGFYSNAIIGAAFTGYDVDRPIEWNGFQRNADSKPAGGEFFSLLAFGYDWKLGNFTFGPSVSVQYTYLNIGSFTESGADSLSLRVSSFDTNSFRSYLGGRVAYT